MNKMEFATLLSRLVERPVPPLVGRHVYLWHGEPADLRGIVPAGLGVELDLYAMAATLPKAPFALDEARRLLQHSIAAWLRENAAPPGARQIVIVTGNSLLQRYRVPLEAFFQASSETRVIVFAVSRRETGYQPVRPMPAYVDLDPSAALEFLKSQLGDHAFVGEMPS